MGRKLLITVLIVMFVGSVISEGFMDSRCPGAEDPYLPTHLNHPSDCKFKKQETDVVKLSEKIVFQVQNSTNVSTA